MNIGKLIVEAYGGKTRAKYGYELIKKWYFNELNSFVVVELKFRNYVGSDDIIPVTYSIK